MAKKSNPSMTTKHVLLLGVGALVGGGVGYAVGANRAKPKEKESKLGPGEPPQIPEKPGGPGLQSQGYREPVSTGVELPSTPGQRDQLDETICSVFRGAEEAPSTDDVTMGVLQKLVPDVQWPTVEGDHWSLIVLQALVGFRVQQIAVDSDPGKTPAQNLDDFCPKIGTFESP